ncbi:LITAF domain-containing protein-like [Ptychodera flava]|uniref:LITAF domain-containing protein-like n=1 Tax=Ptychodera flava TaxID=63121 RepID=UPI00396A66EB
MEYSTNYDTKYSDPIGNPPPPPAYAQAQSVPPPPGQGTAAYTSTSVVVGQPTVTVVAPLMLRDVPISCNCPTCHQNIVTNVEFKVGGLTWIICCFLWLIGLGLGCCLIPFCVNSCKDAVHTCPNCNSLIGKYSRL